MADAPDAPAPDAPGPGPAEDGRLTPAELGAHLGELRTAAGLSVEDVAARTRIRASLIRGMESGDFAPCGGAVYARGHLRSIAHVVHADDGALVAAYDRMAGQPSPSAATVVAPTPAAHETPAVPFAKVSTRPLPTPVQVTGTRGAEPQPSSSHPGGPGGPTIVLPGSSAPRERRGSPWVLAAVGVAAAVVVVAALAFAFAGPNHGTSKVTTQGGTPRSSSPVAPTSKSPTTPTPTAPTTVADAGVNVTVSITTSASWVHVVDSGGALVFQGTLAPGTTKSFHAAQQLTFVFGYAPAVHLVVNGHDIGSPPTTGGGDIADATFDTSSGG